MKRQLITFKRILVSGSKNFLRNAWLSSAAILVMTITLVMVSFTAIAFQASNLTIKKVAEKIDITLFVKDSVTDADAKRVSEQIKQIEGVTSVEYLDKQTVYNQQVEDAKARKDQIKLSGYELSGIDGVYSTIKVKTDDPKNLTPIKDQLGKKEYADILDQTNSESSAKQNETINNVTRIASFMRKFGLIISLIFVVISVILIFNTIRMTIFNRKDEIEIMRLIGASVWYIRGPFLVEASLYAFVASIFTMGITYGSIKNSSKLSSFIEIIPVADFIKEYWWLCLLLILVAGIFIGVFSASLAIRKYIRFKVY
ncbi:MAG TPA: permease-like cell division protein FtsX [Candidatus Saccharibacteria bacterium]|jgi:cell division transport system permease protein|nr:permease-like cell division protein FtsX [Candidatus Saccharibacteria bacterium]